MPQQASSVENNFIGGLKTEFTGLNFPENACTDADNVIFTTIGDVLRREGIDLEPNHANWSIQRNGGAISTFKWENVGGDPDVKILVVQIGNALRFWRYSSATLASPMSAQLLGAPLDMTPFDLVSTTDAQAMECQYAEGNGYLFVFHPRMNPFYVTYNAGILTANQITLQMRDFEGVNEPGVDVTVRPSTLSDIHKYNITNQGWTSAAPWTGTSTDVVSIALGAKSFNIASGLTVVLGSQIKIYSSAGAGLANHPADNLYMSGTFAAYVGTLITINVDYIYTPFAGTFFGDWLLIPSSSGFISTWNAAIGNYPSNSDIWWRFKDSSGAFAPATTASNISLNSGNATRGHFILSVFDQQRSVVSGVPNITPITTTYRPKTGTWFQGRVWYAGTDASNPASGTAPFYTWAESIYFSQTAITADQFGMAYQTNDPTGEEFTDLLPTDGGIIKIQGCGSVVKLFPIQNGLLVFATNGIWFITGSQGIGFAANDYTVTKISSVRALSHTSFVTVDGLPIFWNEEGIYTVQPSPQGGGLVVQDTTVGTIATFFAAIPLSSKKYARGDYDPLNFVISWIYKGSEETSIESRYEFDKQLHLNMSNKAFYTYTITATNPVLHDIKYIYGLAGANKPGPAFKYLTSHVQNGNFITFSEEYDNTNWTDFHSVNSTNYPSYFVTGYKLHGKALVKWQPTYLNFFSRADRPTAYKIQGIWDYANDPNSGRYSTSQTITNGMSRFGMVYRRHKIRGRGLALQLKVTSVDGMPFDIMGWSSIESLNTGM
jgi:hypothetical protein